MGKDDQKQNIELNFTQENTYFNGLIREHFVQQ